MIRKNLKKLTVYIFILTFCFNNISASASSPTQISDPNWDKYEPFDQDELDEEMKEIDEWAEEVDRELDEQEKEIKRNFENEGNKSVWVHYYKRIIFGRPYSFSNLFKKLNMQVYDGDENGKHIGYRVSVGDIRKLYTRILEIYPKQSYRDGIYFFAALNMLEQISLQNQFKLTLEANQVVEIIGDITSDSSVFVNVLPYQRLLETENGLLSLNFFWLWYYICCKLNYNNSDEPVFEPIDSYLINIGHVRYMYDLAREMLEEDVLSPQNVIYAQLAKNMAEQIAIENNFALTAY